MIRTLILVGLGGGIGSVFRYLTTFYVTKYFQAAFPWGTLIVNILGSLIIGLLLGLFARGGLPHPDFKFLFVAGFCGGYTTFSAFSLESITLFQSDNSFLALLYIAASVLISLFVVWIGLTVMKL